MLLVFFFLIWKLKLSWIIHIVNVRKSKNDLGFNIFLIKFHCNFTQNYNFFFGICLLDSRLSAGTGSHWFLYLQRQAECLGHSRCSVNSHWVSVTEGSLWSSCILILIMNGKPVQEGGLGVQVEGVRRKAEPGMRWRAGRGAEGAHGGLWYSIIQALISVCQIQLLPLCTDSLEGGKHFPSGFSNEICMMGTDVKCTVPAPFPGQISEEIHAEVRGRRSRNMPVIASASPEAGGMCAGRHRGQGQAGVEWFFPSISFQIMSR